MQQICDPDSTLQDVSYLLILSERIITRTGYVLMVCSCHHRICIGLCVFDMKMSCRDRELSFLWLPASHRFAATTELILHPARQRVPVSHLGLGHSSLLFLKKQKCSEVRGSYVNIESSFSAFLCLRDGYIHKCFANNCWCTEPQNQNFWFNVL